MGGIADQFSVTSEDVRKWNGLKDRQGEPRHGAADLYRGGRPRRRMRVKHSSKSTVKKKTASSNSTTQP